ncbi:hypothetical protein FKR81_29705 [Lentzea tibetensis]|uniref:Ig-like domain-containing protein n=1 Tax=Lentzea tibetensis TaxID=2591470 RepID=A0A563ELY0_9PSEU|nr:hypothetical protein [Lentzea tibetensis]TWP48157.1 hypothetical protein FKR81_29705 [Lentzea tibetensis]
MPKLSVALSGALLLTAFATPVAFADPVALECVGAKSAKYSPGLTLEPQEQAILLHATYAPCAGNGGVTSATQVHQVTKNASCLSVGEANPGTADFTWNIGETSTFTYEATVERPAGQLVTTKRGTFTSGKFAGAAVVEVAAGATPNVAECLAGGIKTIDSTITLTIVQQ